MQTILAFDNSALHAIFMHRNPIALEFFMHVTQLGSVIAVLFLSLAITLILLLHYRRAEMIGLVTAVGGTAIASALIKQIIARPRPDLAVQAYPETGYSFPSEHTALTMALTIFLVYLVFRLSHSQALRTMSISFGLLLVAAAAFSRLYLGVHYPSDVFAGAILGAIMAMIGIRVERSLEHLNIRPSQARARRRS